jgi:integrase/recombinase XerD
MRRRAKLHLPFDQWPLDDRLLWEQATKGSDPFSEATGARLSAASKQQYLFAWRRFLGFLAIREPSAIQLSPAARLTRDRLRAFADHRAETHIPRSVAIQADALYKAARIMLPEHDLSWLKSFKARLHSAAPLQRASGPIVTSLQILRVGQQLMDDQDPRTERRLALAKAIRCRDGLMIALLAFLPLRRKNLAALEINRHFVQEGTHWFIIIPAADTKTRTPIEFAIPALLLSYFSTYLQVVRPRMLRDPECQAFWVSPKGGALRYGAIGDIISRHTEAVLGIRLTPHDTRGAAATTWALNAPSQVRVSRDLLSHSDLRTTEKHYNRARGVEASRAYALILGKMRTRR